MCESQICIGSGSVQPDLARLVLMSFRTADALCKQLLEEHGGELLRKQDSIFHSCLLRALVSVCRRAQQFLRVSLDDH